MKYLLTLLLLLSFTFVNAQTQQPQVNLPPDTVKVLSKTDLVNFITFVRKNVSAEDYDNMKPLETINQLYMWFAREEAARQQKPKKETPKK